MAISRTWKIPKEAIIPKFHTNTTPHLAEQASYALAKQLPTARSLETDYGPIELDDELSQAIEATLTPILERRAKTKAADLTEEVRHG